MSIECTIDLQLSELGFPVLLQTSEASVRETPCRVASQYGSLSGNDLQTPIPILPTRKQGVDHYPPALPRAKDSSSYSPRKGSDPAPSIRVSNHAPPRRGSDPAPPSRGSDHAPPSRGSNHSRPNRGSKHAPTSRGSDHALTHPVPSHTAPRSRAGATNGPPAAQTTEHLADGEQSHLKSSKVVNEDKASNETAKITDDEAESSDDSDASDDESPDEDPDDPDDESDGTGEHHCAVCHLQLRSNAKLQDHMNLHTGQRPHCCAECGKRFCQLKNYRTHLKTHAQPKVASSLQCRVCRKVFSSEEKLRAHLTSTHFEQEFFECDLCKMVFTDRTKCQQHVEDHRDAFARLGCDTCGRRFSTQQSLDRHRTRKCLLSFICTDCSQAFPRKSALLRHSFSHIGLRPFTCQQCNSHFRLAKLYLRHKCEPKRIHCAACLKAFPSERALGQHQKDTGCWGHQEPKQGDEIRCPECGKSFATREELKAHGGAHQRILTCDACGKGFRSALILMSHMGGHAAQTPCLCQRCGRGFLHQHDYDRHLERCGLAPLPATMSKKRAQKSPAPPVQLTPLPAAELPLAATASTTSGAVTLPNDVSTPSPQNGAAQGSCPPTGDRPTLVGLNLIVFVPINHPLALQDTLPPATTETHPASPAQQTQRRTPAVMDAAFDLHKSIMDQMTRPILPEVNLPPVPVTNVNAAPLDLSKKVTNVFDKFGVKAPAVSLQRPAVGATAPGAVVTRQPVGVQQPAVGAETVSMNTPAASYNMPPVSIKTEAVSIKIEAVSPAHSVETPDCSIKVETKECWVVLRRWSGKTHDMRGDTR